VIVMRMMKKNVAMKNLKWFLTECKPRPVMATIDRITVVEKVSNSLNEYVS